MLARGNDPAAEDLNAALMEAPDALPRELLDYTARAYVRASQPRRPGPKRPTRSTSQDMVIKAYYQRALVQARSAHEANSRQSRAFAKVAKEKTAAMFHVSTRTVDRIVADRAWRHPPAATSRSVPAPTN